MPPNEQAKTPSGSEGKVSSHAPYGEDNHQEDNHHEDENNDNSTPLMRPQRSMIDFKAATVGTVSASGNYALPISWHKLRYSAGKLKILRGLTGTALPSRCLAIMGSSGAGKTTFLNAICDRLATSRTLKLRGTRQLADVEFERHYRKVMAFVTQDDIISSLGTPEDTLSFSLRVRRGASVDETRQRVAETLQELKLVHCKNTLVGIPGLVAGLSGGERKRCNIGTELITDPKVLLLDEPTSGLDSVTSAKIVHLLNDLSRNGRTIIYTIHQPTAEVLSYFDDLMLISQGKCVYHGTMENSVPYFREIGFACPDHYTPSDYFMTLMQDPPTSKRLIKIWKHHLKTNKRTAHTMAIRLASNQEDAQTTLFLEAFMEKMGSSLWIQFLELTKRSAIELSRDHLLIFAYFSQAAFFAIVVGLIFVNLHDNIYGIQDREGLLFMAVTNRIMGSCFIMINSFPKVKPVFIREQQAGAYSPFMYFITKSIVEFPMQIGFSMLEALILYFMTGLHYSAGSFFHYYGAITLASQVGTGLGFAISASFDSLVLASSISPLILLPLMLAGGLLASTKRLRPYWYWLEKPSMIRHAYILTVRREMESLDTIYCNNYLLGDFYCNNQPKKGSDVLLTLGFDDPQSKDWMMWISMAILFVLTRIVCVIALARAGRQKA